MTAKHLNLENQNIQRPSSKFAGDVWERTRRCRPLSKVTASKGNQNAFNQIFGLFSVVIQYKKSRHFCNCKTFSESFRYPGLTIKYVRGKDPIIKLLDEDDDVVEELAIDKWNTDSVEEFLSMYIEQQEEAINQNDTENIP